MTSTTRLLAALVALAACALLACGDSSSPAADASPDTVGADTTAPDTTGDAASPQDTASDDSGPSADAAAEVSPPAPVIAENPLARVFLQDPITDGGLTSEVTLARPVTADGTLTGEYVDVRNCLNEEGGEPIGFVATLCREDHLVTPNAEGHYLHVGRPATDSDPGDLFAELMMYHHVNVMHDYFKDVHGLTDLDRPIQALVNVMIYAEFLGGWQPFPNAAFMPAEAFEQFGLPPRAEGAIVFGQFSNTDFAYDASVIYHEYTHAMIGTTRLTGVLGDTQGLDILPGSMNEGFADYFATSVLENPIIGAYALTFQGPQFVRDLTLPRRCPDDLYGEVHADGKIIGSAMWAIREELGRDVTDGIILRALQSFTQTTNLDLAGNLLLVEAGKIDQATAEVFERVLTEHGVIGCQRAKEWKRFGVTDQANNPELLPYFIAGPQAAGGIQLPDGAPAYFQFYVDVPAGTEGVTLLLSAASQNQLTGQTSTQHLDLAVRKGQPVVFNLFGGSVTSDAKLTPPDGVGATQGVTLTGACLPEGGGRVYLMPLNPSGGGAAINFMDVEYLDSVDGAQNPATCE